MEIEEDGFLPFLDRLTKREKNRIAVEVYRKPTHTNKYLDFNSCHPKQHKRSIVKTLLDRAEKIPSSSPAQAREIIYTREVLKENGYTTRFQNSCKRRLGDHPKTNDDTNNTSNHFVTIPYVQGVSETIGRILRKEGLKISYKRITVLPSILAKPKDAKGKEQTAGIAYKLPCGDCDFVYYGQTQRD